MVNIPGCAHRRQVWLPDPRSEHITDRCGTIVGLLWNLFYYFYQNQDSLKTAIIAEPKILPDLPGYKEMSVFDKLWMCLFSRLGDLCLDPRPATRKSAGQVIIS